MTNLSAVVAQLKQERSKLDQAIAALSGIAGNSGGGGARRKLSAEARERIAAAQRKRWAKFKSQKA
jgi:ABC-type transporter Mla subunit MlaD